MSEELARMRDVGFGNRDYGKPCLFFTAQLEDGQCSLQILHRDRALEVIEESGVYDVHGLDGMFCWVDKGPVEAKFLRLWGQDAQI